MKLMLLDDDYSNAFYLLLSKSVSVWELKRCCGSMNVRKECEV